MPVVLIGIELDAFKLKEPTIGPSSTKLKGVAIAFLSSNNPIHIYPQLSPKYIPNYTPHLLQKKHKI